MNAIVPQPDTLWENPVSQRSLLQLELDASHAVSTAILQSSDQESDTREQETLLHITSLEGELEKKTTESDTREQETLLHITSLEGELEKKTAEADMLKRAHERTTAKLAHLLKTRSAGEDAAESETEASQELQLLHQQVSILKWREEQYKKVLVKVARCAAHRVSPTSPRTLSLFASRPTGRALSLLCSSGNLYSTVDPR